MSGIGDDMVVEAVFPGHAGPRLDQGIGTGNRAHHIVAPLNDHRGHPFETTNIGDQSAVIDEHVVGKVMSLDTGQGKGAAAVAVGVYPDYPAAVKAMTRIARRHEPNPDLAEIYRQKSERYQTVAKALAAIS